MSRLAAVMNRISPNKSHSLDAINTISSDMVLPDAAPFGLPRQKWKTQPKPALHSSRFSTAVVTSPRRQIGRSAGSKLMKRADCGARSFFSEPTVPKHRRSLMLGRLPTSVVFSSLAGDAPPSHCCSSHRNTVSIIPDAHQTRENGKGSLLMA